MASEQHSEVTPPITILPTPNKLGSFFAWVFGILFLLIGLSSLSTSLLSGLAGIFTAILLIPPLYSFLLSKISVLSQKKFHILGVVLGIISLIFTSGDRFPRAYAQVTSSQAELRSAGYYISSLRVCTLTSHDLTVGVLRYKIKPLKIYLSRIINCEYHSRFKNCRRF